MPSLAAEIGSGAMLVMVVVIAFTHHQEVKWQQISGLIFHFEIAVSPAMGKPVDNGAMQWAHHEVNRQKEVHPPFRCEVGVEADVYESPGNSHNRRIGKKFEIPPFGSPFGKRGSIFIFSLKMLE